MRWLCLFIFAWGTLSAIDFHWERKSIEGGAIYRIGVNDNSQVVAFSGRDQWYYQGGMWIRNLEHWKFGDIKSVSFKRSFVFIQNGWIMRSITGGMSWFYDWNINGEPDAISEEKMYKKGDTVCVYLLMNDTIYLYEFDDDGTYRDFTMIDYFPYPYDDIQLDFFFAFDSLIIAVGYGDSVNLILKGGVSASGKIVWDTLYFTKNFMGNPTDIVLNRYDSAGIYISFDAGPFNDSCILYSTDRGLTWHKLVPKDELNKEIGIKRIEDMEIVRKDTMLLAVSLGAHGIYYCDLTTFKFRCLDSTAHSSDIDYNSGGEVWVATDAGAMVMSDFGEFMLNNDGLYAIYCHEWSATKSVNDKFAFIGLGKRFVGLLYGVYNYGEFKFFESAPKNNMIAQIYPENGNIIYANGFKCYKASSISPDSVYVFYRTCDFGTNWEYAEKTDILGLLTTYYYGADMWVSPSDSSVICRINNYPFAGGAVIRSDDCGATWNMVLNSKVKYLEGSDTVFASGETTFVSYDKGLTWEEFLNIGGRIAWDSDKKLLYLIFTPNDTDYYLFKCNLTGNMDTLLHFCANPDLPILLTLSPQGYIFMAYFDTAHISLFLRSTDGSTFVCDTLDFIASSICAMDKAVFLAEMCRGWMRSVYALPPEKPVLSEPASGSVINDNTPTLHWKRPQVLGKINYILQYSTDSGFTNNVITIKDITDTFYTLPPTADTVIYWRVKAIDIVGQESDFTDAFKLIIDATPPLAPYPLSPADSQWFNITSITLKWTEVKWTKVFYYLEFASDSAFDSLISYVSGLQVNKITLDFDEGTYWWRVWAYDEAGNKSDYSEKRVFFVDTTPPPAPILKYPPDDTILNSPYVTLIWSGEAEEYIMHLSTSPDVETSQVEVEVEDTIVEIEIPLGNATYYWFVEAVDKAGNKSTSDTFSFSISASLLEIPIKNLNLNVYPNPSKGKIILSISVPYAMDINLSVYDVLGRCHAVLYKGRIEKGLHTFEWNGNPGVYFVKMKTGEKEIVKKVINIR